MSFMAKLASTIALSKDAAPGHVRSFNEQRPLKLKADAISIGADLNDRADAEKTRRAGSSILSEPGETFSIPDAKKFVRRGNEGQFICQQYEASDQSKRSSSRFRRWAEFAFSACWRPWKSSTDSIAFQDNF